MAFSRVALVAVGLLACGDSGRSGAAATGDGVDGGGETLEGGSAARDTGPAILPDGAPGPGSAWLHTQANKILRADGTVWHGRGANLHDTRSCDACSAQPPDTSEVLRRADELVDVWGANFVRLVLESYGTSGGRVQYKGVLDDPGYLDSVRQIVAHLAAKKDVYVLLSLWLDPTFTGEGWPSAATRAEWQLLAGTFKDEPRVLFGLVNEPEDNFDGSEDAQVWDAMNQTVAAIRAVEGGAHIVAVQGTGGWARRLDYYVSHPIAAGGGKNVAYEVHVYDPKTLFSERFVTPAKTLPVIIGEFGPVSGDATMTLDDCGALIDAARQLDVPHLAWTFHPRCPPNLLVDNSGTNGCGVQMPLQPTPDWGVFLKSRLAQPW